MREPNDDVLDDDAIHEFASARVSGWCPGVAPAGVAVVRALHKRHSTVHELALTAPGGETERAFVKQPRGRDDDGGPSRPRAISEVAAGDKIDLQRAALDDLERAVRAADHPHLAAVRVLDALDEQLIVLSAAEGEPLRDIVLRSVRWRRPGDPDLEDVFGRAGSLLRIFHDEVVRPDAPVALASRDEIQSVGATFAGFLADRTARSRVADLQRRFETQVQRHLPESLPTTTRFGDFGLTNLLVTADGTVTAIDTMAALRVPPLHDGTYLLTGLSAVRPQVMTAGLAIARSDIDRWQQAFWTGYCAGRPVPEGAIAVWTCLRLYERWSAKTTRTATAWRRRGPGAVVDSYLARLIDRSLSAAEAADPDHDAVLGLS